MLDDIALDLSNQKTGFATLFRNQATTLTLTITNRTGQDVLISPGTPANPPSAGAFALTVDFSEVITGSQDGLVFVNPQWTAKFFTAPFPAWVLTANEAITWAANRQLAFDIENITADVAVGTYYAQFGVYNLAPDPLPFSVLTGVIEPPVGKQRLGDRVSATLKKPEVLITKTPSERIKNGMTLQLVNKDPNQPVVTEKWSVPPPQLNLSFVYDERPGFYALTTTGNAKEIGVDGKPAVGWNSPERDDTGPFWKLTPLDTNQQVIGTGENAIVEFAISNIVTQLEPGSTVVYLQYFNFPGYDDGFLPVDVIDKSYPEMSLLEWSIDQTSFRIDDTAPGELAGHPTMQWVVQYGVETQVAPFGLVEATRQLFTFAVDMNMPTVLTAFDPFTGTIIGNRFDLTVDPPVSERWVPRGMIVPWQGDDVPAGWALCDGSPGTPDLRDRFVVGWGSTFPLGQQGDAQHRHAINSWKADFVTSELTSSHGHAFPSSWSHGKRSSGDSDGIRVPPGDALRTADEAWRHKHTLPVDVNGFTDNAGPGGLRPRWWALRYIIKL